MVIKVAISILTRQKARTARPHTTAFSNLSELQSAPASQKRASKRL